MSRGRGSRRATNLVASVVLAVLVGVVWPACAVAGPPTIHRWELENGLVVMFVERRAIPAIQAHLVVKTGAAADPDGRIGLAALTSNMILKGTAKRSAADIAEAVDFVGARLSSDVSHDHSSLTLTLLKKDLAFGMNLLSEVVLQPSFPASDVERVRRETLSRIAAGEDEPEVVAAKAFAPLVFGRHPYARPVEGSEESVRVLTREELVAFHRTYYVPNNSVLILVGDLSRREARRAVSEAFGNWGGRDIPALRSIAMPNRRSGQVLLIERDLTQATVVMGHDGIARSDPDFYAATVMNYVLGGGGFASRLMTRIRDNEGLVYGISSGFDAKQRGGAFSIDFQTKTESAPAAVRAVLEETRTLRAEGVSEQELDGAKQYLSGSFPLRYETNSRLSSLLGFVLLYDLGTTYFEDYPRRIRAVTQDDVLRVAQRLLDPDRFILLVVGRTDRIAKELQALVGEAP